MNATPKPETVTAHVNNCRQLLSPDVLAGTDESELYPLLVRVRERLDVAADALAEIRRVL
jgi:hypothetical protein